MASIAFLAQNKTITAACLARAGLRRRQPLEVLLQLAVFMQAAQLLRSAHVPPADEDSRQGQFGLLRLPEDPLQLVHEPGIHRQIPLVDRYAERAQD